jgi:hypothetical protein
MPLRFVGRRFVWLCSMLAVCALVGCKRNENAQWIHDRWEVGFFDGVSEVEYDPPGDVRGNAFRYMGPRARLHLRSLEHKPMQLRVAGWVNVPVLQTKPTVEFYLDGVLLESVPVERGPFEFVRRVAGPRYQSQLEVRLSSVGFHDANPPSLMVAVLYLVDWSEAKD